MPTHDRRATMTAITMRRRRGRSRIQPRRTAQRETRLALKDGDHELESEDDEEAEEDEEEETEEKSTKPATPLQKEIANAASAPAASKGLKLGARPRR